MDILTVGLRIHNRKVHADFSETLSSFKELSLQEFAHNKPYDLLILEIGEDLENDFDLVQAIQTSGLIKDFFLTSTRMEPDFLIRALRAGAREFIPQPVKKEEVAAAIKKLLEKKTNQPCNRRKDDKHGEIIYVMGSKGGVGTTTIAVNLATSLVKSSPDSSIALVDMNFLFGEIPTFLNIHPEFNWGEVSRNFSRLDSHYLMSIFARHKNGVYILPSPTGLDGLGSSTPEIIERILCLMKPAFDFIVIDGGQSLDEVSLKMLEMTDFLCLIAILSLPCLTNAKRLLRTFEKLGHPRNEQIKIIINRFYKNSLISLKEAEAALNKKAFGLVEHDYAITLSAINQGKTLEDIAPGAEVTKNIRTLASGFIGLKKV